MNGTGELSNLFRMEGCAFLWVHATQNSVIFVILTTGDCRVRVGKRAVLDRLSGLFREMNRAVAAWQPSSPRAHEYEVLSLKATVFVNRNGDHLITEKGASFARFSKC
jgi:hypothetical protein